MGGARDIFICLKCVKKLEGKEERVCLAGDMGQGGMPMGTGNNLSKVSVLSSRGTKA